MATSKQKASAPTSESADILQALRQRFEKNMKRHKGILWEEVQSRIAANPKKLESLRRMEQTGGEPDVIGFDKKNNQFLFCDCSAESPKDRRSYCYDAAALASRKEHKPKDNALDAASSMGIEITTEAEYRALQQLGEFDTKTSSWILTPDNIRELGGALFCDRRFDTVFTYHNGAESYYAARGFRGILRV